MISPVRLRAKASGLTRMSVRSMDNWAPGGIGGLRGGLLGTGRAGGARLLGGCRGGGCRGGCLTPAAVAARGRGRGRRGADLGLAVRAHLPVRIERASARLARVLELAHAAGTAQIILLD